MMKSVTVGKFFPFHKGHEAMILFGAAVCGSIDVIVSGNESDDIPLNERYLTVRDRFIFDDRINVHYHVDNIPMGEVDENGTVLCDTFWKKWVGVFKYFSPNAEYFVSSDMYGEVAAKKLGIKWVPFDPKREMFPISGTMIRNDPGKYREYVATGIRYYDFIKIVILGAESTGKSTMAKKLRDVFGGGLVTEYGRTISELKRNNLSKEDFDLIVRGQDAMIETVSGMYPITFIDTEAYTSYCFNDIYLGEKNDEYLKIAKSQSFDMYILLKNNVEWVDDGERVLSDKIKRDEFHEKLVSFLSGKPTFLIEDADFDARLNLAIEAVKNRKEEHDKE